MPPNRNQFKMKTHKLIGLVAALLPLLPSLVSAQVTIKVSTTEEANIIRRDISRTTFGTGLQADTAEFGWAMKSQPFSTETAEDTSKLAVTANTFKWLQFGSFRFPNGDSSFKYIWDAPSFNLCFADNDDCSTPERITISNQRKFESAYAWNLWITPDAIIDYTRNADQKLNMERVFMVNTVKSHSTEYPHSKYIDANVICRQAQPPEERCYGVNFSDVNLQDAANYAAQWVRKDGNKTKFWEIGNEDWTRLHPNEYAKILTAFQQKMLAENKGIKIIAQGLEENFKASGLEKQMGVDTINTPEDWLDAMVTDLGRNVNNIYAYAIHDYLTAPVYADLKKSNPDLRRKKQTQDLFLQVQSHAKYNPTNPKGQVAVQTVKDLLQQKNLSWKLWMTEFNLSQTDKNAAGETVYEPLQDMGHGLVIADWVGELLQSNIERMFYHDMSHHPAFGMVDFGQKCTVFAKNTNGKEYCAASEMKDAKVHVPGHIYSMYAKNFGQTMVKNTTTQNRVITPETPPEIKNDPNKPPVSYKQLGVYSSISSNDQELRIMVVNRDLDNKAIVNIDTDNVPGRRILADGKYCFRKISSEKISDSNIVTADKVKWTDPIYVNQSSAGIVGQVLDRGSVSLFVIPLKPNNTDANTLAPVVDCDDTVKRQTDMDGFELSPLAAGGYAYGPQGGAWAFSGTSGGGIQRDGSAWNAKAAPEGQQTAFLQGGDAHMTQTAQLEPGIHSISFYAARRASDGVNTNPVQVKVNGIPIGRPISPNSTEFIKYTTESFPLNTQGNYTIEFVSTNNRAGDSTTFVDAVSILSAPKP
jgi:hypothetical protein